MVKNSEQNNLRTTLGKVLELKRGRSKRIAAELKQLFDAFMPTVEKLANIIDQL